MNAKIVIKVRVDPQTCSKRTPPQQKIERASEATMKRGGQLHLIMKALLNNYMPIGKQFQTYWSGYMYSFSTQFKN